MRVKNVAAVAYKQWLDASAVKSIAVQFLLYPVLLWIFTLGRDSAARTTLVAVLSPMLIGSSPMLTVHSLIREDKHSGALKALMLASVRPGEYMAGVSLFLIGISALASAFMGILGGVPIHTLLWFILAMTLTSTLTILLGCAASLRTANQSNAVLFISVFSLINGMIPALEALHPTIHTVTRFWYTQQVKDMTLRFCGGHADTLLFGFGVIGINLLLILSALFFTYRKTRLFEN
ncbi:MAG: hypothetical protein J6D21_13360 [Clostridia bacterium]|nr:hypothetical protein [Clostridia bacterium]